MLGLQGSGFGTSQLAPSCRLCLGRGPRVEAREEQEKIPRVEGLGVLGLGFRGLRFRVKRFRI